MIHRRICTARRIVGSLLFAAAVLVAIPAASQAACPWDGPAVLTNTTSFGRTWTRMLTVNNSVCGAGVIDPSGAFVLCDAGPPTFPPIGSMTLRVQFYLPSNTTGKRCKWTCGGEQCDIRGGDGLPVELLGFSVD